MFLASALLLLFLEIPISDNNSKMNNTPCLQLYPNKGRLLDSSRDSAGRVCSFEDYKRDVSHLFLWGFNHNNGIEVIIETRLEYHCKKFEVVEILDTRGNNSRRVVMVDTLTKDMLYTKLFHKHCLND